MHAIEPGILLDPSIEAGAVDDVLVSWMNRISETGHDGAFIDVDAGLGTPQRKAILERLRALPGSPRALARATVRLEHRQSIKQDLQGIRVALGVDALAVSSSSAEVLNFVARDGRVDIITIDAPEAAGAFNDGIASLASQANTFIELPFKPLLTTRGAARSKLLRVYGKVIDTCHDNHARILFPSWATSPVDVKTPWQQIVVLAMLLGVSKQDAREIVLRNPAELASPARRGRGRIVVIEPDGGAGEP